MRAVAHRCPRGLFSTDHGCYLEPTLAAEARHKLDDKVAPTPKARVASQQLRTVARSKAARG